MSELVWRRRLSDEETREALALLDAAAAADGTTPVSEAVLLNLRHGAEADYLLARAPDGALAGFAQLTEDAVAELAVRPDRRRRGLGTQLVRALVERVGSTRGTGQATRLRVWAHGEHPAAVALARRLGFTRTRVLLQLRRSLRTPLPAVEFPPGVRLRTFVVGQDEEEFLRVNNAAFAWHPEQGGWDLPQVRAREGEPWFDPKGFLLAVDDHDRLLGFHWTKVHPTGDGDDPRRPVGEVYVVGVDPAAQGRGLGAALTLAGLHYLRDRGLNQVLLYVEADNTPAVRLYTELGFTRWSADVVFESPPVPTAGRAEPAR